MKATVRQRTLRATTLIAAGLAGILLVSGDPAAAWRSTAFLTVTTIAVAWTVVENLVLKQDEPPAYTGKLTTRLTQAGVLVGMYAAAVHHYRFEPWLLPANLAVTLAGGAVMVAGAGVRIWAIRTLDRHFRYELRVESDQRLVTGGPYRIVRHPSYLGVLLVTVGAGLAFGSLPGMLVAFAWLFGVFLVRIPQEESVLGASWGEAFEAYRARTWRMIPFVY